MLSGLAVQPDVLQLTAAKTAAANDSYDWNEDTAAEQLRQDQCLMADVLRLGGPSMATTAQDGLNQTPAKLRELANRDHWENTPLSAAYQKDKDAASKELNALNALRDGWGKPLTGLTTPAGFTETGFHWPPGTANDGKDDFYGQTGLTKWTAERFWKDEGDFYQDSTPRADAATVKAVKDLGAPLYGTDPDPGLPSDEWNRALAERDAFKHLSDWSLEPTGADNARLFLASGGFPRTAPQPGTVEYRIAVEDLKSRFSACAWRDPIDPSKVLDDISSTAATEWQQEVSAQAAQRNQILGANKDATTALAAGAKALGDMLGHSWTADHLTRWQDYWSAGGVGYVGDAPAVIEVPGASGKCLDIPGGAKTNGSPVQIYTCNGKAQQQWEVYGDDEGLHLRNVNSLKCLDVSGASAENGTKIQIWTCNSSPAQTWEYNLRAATALKNTATDKCLDLANFTNSTDGRLWTCSGGNSQKYSIKPSGHTGTVPPKAQFDKAKAGITAAQAAAKKQLAVLKAQLAAAQKAVTTSDTAEQAAYTIADQAGAPRGRGLLVGQQKAQVTKGAAAALTAMVKAGETAEAATRAAAADSDTITQRALAQAAQAKAEFRKKAAEAAEWQAKAAADAAKVHRDNAKKDKETAEAKLAVALKAEGDAKAAAADAHAKRLAAEAEEKTAKAEKETAEAKQAEAARHKENAQAEASNAKEAKEKAEAAESTAVEKKNAAVQARDNAKAKRDDAWDAEHKANAARAKAAAKDAYAEAHESDSNAQESRAAADAADGHADDAEAAAGRARSEANAATQAAADADAAATRAEAAAKRARAHADGAQAAKLRADAAVKTATAAVADAIKAAAHAAAEAKTAVELADEAEQHAKTAKSQADEANKEAAKALVASAKAAGFAHVTAQAAVDAGNAAAQVVQPANDAIQLGSPYVTTDSAAGLVVLTGQASKSIAEQQKAVADAHAKNAQEEAAAAKALAEQAKGDAKAAYQHAANAAGHAADARGYAKEALGYAADAALAASKASQSLARSIEYQRQATEDAAAADKAAGRAEGYAKDARAAADQAALDAAAARAAASEAEQAAKDARAAAERADAAATEAEEAAKDAQKYADSAQQAADQAGREDANKQVQAGAGTGIGGVFSVIDDLKQKGDPQRLPDDCSRLPCDLVYEVTFDAVVSYYLCANPDVPATESGCPAEDTFFLTTKTFPNLTKTVKVSSWEATKNLWKGLYESIIGDFTGCYHKLNGDGSGSYGDCAWAASNFIPNKTFDLLADAIRALNTALRRGDGVADALKSLKELDVDPETLADIERTVDRYEEARTACKINSFPGGTEVVLADGSRKPIREVRFGDQLLATDPGTGTTRGEAVTRTFSHTTEDLLDITLADGGSLTSTPGHQVFVVGRGWTLASDLRTGDRLRTPDGTLRTVTALRDRDEPRPRTVYDLTVSGLHTFYAVADDTPVLVHNCNDLIVDEGKYPGQAHILEKHVDQTQAEALAMAQADGEKVSVFIDLQTAQQVVDYAIVNKAGEIATWLRGSQQKKTLTGTFGGRNSLGWVAHPDGRRITQAGNRYTLVLKRAPGHKSGFYVFTGYPG